MAFRSVIHSHPCRNYAPVMEMDFHRIPPGSAKDLNSHRDSALAIRRCPAALSFSDQAVSARRRNSVMGRTAAAVYCASPSSADPFDSRDFVPGFAASFVAGYSSPAADLAFVLGFVAFCLVIAALVVVVVLSFDPSCSAAFSAALAAFLSAAFC